MSERSNPDRRVPLVIGVTGHPDLCEEDFGQLREGAAAIFPELRKKYRNTPLVLLTGLTEEADRVVAEEFLRQRKAAPDPDFWRLVRVPSEPPSATEFKETEYLAEFMNLPGKGNVRLFVEYTEVDHETTVRGQADQRREGSGEYIARRSQILIALWNGLPSKETTAEMVRSKRRGLPESEFQPTYDSLLEPAEGGPVYQIVARRRSDPRCDGLPGNLQPRPCGYSFFGEWAI